jgi:hypothetical protein
MAIYGILAAVLAFFSEEFGLSLDVTAVLGGLVVALTYIFWEAKDDIARIKAQPHRWRDPKFWVAFISTVLLSLNEQLGMNIPVDVLSPVLVIVITAMFKWLRIGGDEVRS